MLDPDPFTEERMPRPCDIDGGEHARRRGLKLFVDENAVVYLKPRLLGQLDSRHDPDSHDREVAFEHPAAGGAHARDRAVAFEALHAVAEQQLDAVLGVHVAVKSADLRAEDPLVRELERIDDAHLQSAQLRPWSRCKKRRSTPCSSAASSGTLFTV